MHDTTQDTSYDWNDKLQDEGAWNRLKGKVRAEYGDVTDQEFEQVRGNWEQFKGFVQQKTGEASDTIENKLKELFT